MSDPSRSEAPTLVMNIKREFFAQIVAIPPTKTIEYRDLKDYWLKRLEKVGDPPFNLRLLNGMLSPVPEAIVQVVKVVKNKKAGEIEFHLGKVISVSHWDRKKMKPMSRSTRAWRTWWRD